MASNRASSLASNRAMRFLTTACLAAATSALGCASRPPFPLRAPMTRDTDLEPTHVDCAKRPNDKDPNHVACAPEPYVSPLAWDGLDNTIFRPLAKVFAADPPREAVNVN